MCGGGGGVAGDAQVDGAVRRGASAGNKHEQAASCLGGPRQQLQLQLHVRQRRQRHWAMSMAMAMAMAEALTSGSFAAMYPFPRCI